MKRAGSDDHQTVFQTDPPLTEEVLECAIKHFLGESYRHALSVKNGFLVVARVGITPDDRALWEERLTEAETFLQKQKASVQDQREKDLQARAKATGVPLED